MGTAVISVRVGKEPSHQDFTVHESLIRKSSPFFEAALGRDWLESEQRILRLPDYTPKVFRLYTQWLYTGRLHTAVPIQGSGNKWNAKLAEYLNLMSGCLFGQYIHDVPYQDSLVDTIIELEEKNPLKKGYLWHMMVAKYIWEETCEASPLRKLLTDISVWNADCASLDIFDSKYTEKIEEISQRFMFEVLRGAMKRHESDNSLSPFQPGTSTCQYHSHGDNPCYKDKDDRCVLFHTLNYAFLAVV